MNNEDYRSATTPHYEVKHTNPNHADVETCTICGRTGEYSDLRGNLVEMVHDPLGLELLFTGQIRGRRVRFEDWERREIGGIDLLAPEFEIDKKTFPGISADRNTLRVGIAIVSPRRNSP